MAWFCLLAGVIDNPVSDYPVVGWLVAVSQIAGGIFLPISILALIHRLTFATSNAMVSSSVKLISDMVGRKELVEGFMEARDIPGRAVDGSFANQVTKDAALKNRIIQDTRNYFILLAVMRHFENAYHQHRFLIIRTVPMWRGYKKLMRRHMDHPGIQSWFELNRHLFSRRFCRFITQLRDKPLADS